MQCCAEYLTPPTNINVRSRLQNGGAEVLSLRVSNHLKDVTLNGGTTVVVGLT